MEKTEKPFWNVVADVVDDAGIKKYGRKHPSELKRCLENLDDLVERLNSGVTLQQALSFGFFGSEGEDIYRIGQERKGMKETRLYIHAMIVGGEIRILTIGDKDSQKKDINWCHEWVRTFRKQKDDTGNQTP